MAKAIPTFCRKPFQPIDIGGLALWLDGADAGTFTLASGKISQWNDKSGNARHETQGTDAMRPVYVMEALNHKPLLRFAGAQNMDKVFGVTLNQPSMVFAVYKHDSGGAGAQRVFDGSAGLIQVNANMILNGGGSSLTLVTPYARGNYEILCAVYNGTSSAGYINGALKSSGNAGTSGMTRLKLGSSGSNTEYLQGDIAEIIVYNTLFTACWRAKVEKYLSKKWGVVLG